MSLIETIEFTSRGDERGQLISLESYKNVPFDIKRIYYIFATLPDVRRGLHAHRKLKQLLVCTSGRCDILLDDGVQRETICLDRPTVGLLIDGLIWREMYDFSPDCVLMVLANEYYDEADYIRNYEQFLKEI